MISQFSLVSPANNLDLNNELHTMVLVLLGKFEKLVAKPKCKSKVWKPFGFPANAHSDHGEKEDCTSIVQGDHSILGQHIPSNLPTRVSPLAGTCGAK